MNARRGTFCVTFVQYLFHRTFIKKYLGSSFSACFIPKFTAALAGQQAEASEAKKLVLPYGNGIF